MAEPWNKEAPVDEREVTPLTASLVAGTAVPMPTFPFCNKVITSVPEAFLKLLFPF